MPLVTFIQKLLPQPFVTKTRPQAPRKHTVGCRETGDGPRPLRRLGLGTGFVLGISIVLAAPASAQSSLTVEWDSNPESDIAGYVVYFGTTSQVYPTIEDVGNVTSHVFSGLSSSTVYYCAVQAYNSSGLMSDLSPEISFTLQSATGSFSAWASAAGLSGSAALPAAIPFKDGVCNLVKFSFNMNPSGPDIRTLVKGTGTAGLPVFTLDRSGAQPLFTVEYLRRKDGSVIYSPKSTSDFGTFEPMTGTTTVTGIDATWERVVVRKTVSTSTTPKLFGIVEVTMP